MPPSSKLLSYRHGELDFQKPLTVLSKTLVDFPFEHLTSVLQNICQTLWCSVRGFCRSKLDAAADGTRCGENKVIIGFSHKHQGLNVVKFFTGAKSLSYHDSKFESDATVVEQKVPELSSGMLLQVSQAYLIAVWIKNGLFIQSIQFLHMFTSLYFQTST